MSFDYQNIFENSPFTCIISDKNEKIHFVSDNIEKLLGYKRDELDTFKFQTIIHPNSTFLPNTKILVSNFQQNYQLQCSNGHYIWVSDTVVIQTEPITNELRYIHYLTDVTAQKQTEFELEDNQQRLELVLEGTRLGMWDWNPQTNDVFFNERWGEMLGYSYDEIEHNLSTWESKVHPNDLANCYADITAHMEGKIDFYENIHRMKHKDGSWLYILDRGKIAKRDEHGNPIRFTGTHTDISAQKIAELKAQDANQSKSLFLAKMSHEIRTPMNGVLGLLDVLEESNLDIEQQQLIRVIKESGELLLAILNDLLDFSKIEAGKIDIDIHPFSLIQSFENVYNLFSKRAISKEINYDLSIAKNIPTYVEGDSIRFKQILMNLVSNAIKFTDKGDVKIIVNYDSYQKTLVFSVQDTGKGIENIEKIWEEFKQEDTSITRNYGGTGLGLSITKSLVELLKGRIKVVSNIGEGSVFTVELPVKTIDEREIHVIKPQEVNKTYLSELKILVAEDNLVNQLVISKMIESLGGKIDVANNGAEAFSLLEKITYDFLLTDIHMPEMDGFELSKNVNSNITNKPVIVALTADVSAEVSKKCRDAGMDFVVSKPFKKDQIIEILQKNLTCE